MVKFEFSVSHISVSIFRTMTVERQLFFSGMIFNLPCLQGKGLNPEPTQKGWHFRSNLSLSLSISVNHHIPSRLRILLGSLTRVHGLVGCSLFHGLSFDKTHTHTSTGPLLPFPWKSLPDSSTNTKPGDRVNQDSFMTLGASHQIAEGWTSLGHFKSGSFSFR
jgi:hypothetical protein